jgi:hypothetical protein
MLALQGVVALMEASVPVALMRIACLKICLRRRYHFGISPDVLVHSDSFNEVPSKSIPD